MRDINILINGKVLTLAFNSGIVKQLVFNKDILQSEDRIISVSVAENQVIIVTEDPGFRNGATNVDSVKPYNIKENNINAYDWNGNYLWNISEIVGEINMTFFGGCVSSISALCEHLEFDKQKYSEDLEIYTCTAGGKTYVIDLKDKKVIQTLSAK